MRVRVCEDMAPESFDEDEDEEEGEEAKEETAAMETCRDRAGLIEKYHVKLQSARLTLNKIHTHTHTRLTALCPDYTGELVPER